MSSATKNAKIAIIAKLYEPVGNGWFFHCRGGEDGMEKSGQVDTWTRGHVKKWFEVHRINYPKPRKNYLQLLKLRQRNGLVIYVY